MTYREPDPDTLARLAEEARAMERESLSMEQLERAGARRAAMQRPFGDGVVGLPAVSSEARRSLGTFVLAVVGGFSGCTAGSVITTQVGAGSEMSGAGILLCIPLGGIVGAFLLPLVASAWRKPP